MRPATKTPADHLERLLARADRTRDPKACTHHMMDGQVICSWCGKVLDPGAVYSPPQP